MKVLPTKYDGITYRSRLEARWAVVFHKLRIPVGYEHEGYSIGNRGYLPDFIYDGIHIEIKPAIPNAEQAALYYHFANEVGPLLVLCGQPENEQFTAQLYFGRGVYSDFWSGMWLWHGDEWEWSLPIGEDSYLFGGEATMVEFKNASFGQGRKCGFGIGVFSKTKDGIGEDSFLCCPCNLDKFFIACKSHETVEAMRAARAERFGT